MQKERGKATQAGWLNSSGAIGVTAVVCAALILGGCEHFAKDPGTPASGLRGGGIALLNNGEIVALSKDGSVAERCIVCRVAESRYACERRAAERGIPACSAEMFTDLKSSGPDWVYPQLASAGSLASIGFHSGVTNSVVAHGHLPCIATTENGIELVERSNPAYHCTERSLTGGAADYCSCSKL